jgi:poly-gamma-glutamate capsule biosynthesis protein CapA/YwtB (metallophosphatase superfamily)
LVWHVAFEAVTTSAAIRPGKGAARGASAHAIGLAILVTVLAAGAALGAPPRVNDGPVTITLVGDVMLGRRVADIAARDPSGLFEEVRWILRSSDLSMGNLESPLTQRSHMSPNPHELKADPIAAQLLADAGFDVLSLANNHIGDAGPGGVLDTVEAIRSAGMAAVGAGADLAEARRPLLLRVGRLTVGVMAFDATGAGLAASGDPGVSYWDETEAERVVKRVASATDILVVSLHGGVENLPETDPRMRRLADLLVSWGADVVWGHGAHVVQPTGVADDGQSLVTTSLGNFLFDQRGPLTGAGVVLQVLADRSGVVAYRLGATSHRDLRVRWVGWELPEGDAVLFRGEWWSLVRDLEVREEAQRGLPSFEWGDVVAVSSGRVTGGGPQLVVSFRAISGSHPVRDGFPDVQWTDARGRTAHLGIYRKDTMKPVWVAGMVPAPIAGLAACDGALALAYSTLDDPAVFATGAAVWRPVGLVATDMLPGGGQPRCADVDGDGTTEPVILGRAGGS